MNLIDPSINIHHKQSTIMKSLLTTTAISLTVLALNSCGINDPEYQAWKKKKAEEAAATNNPYGAPAAGANPYGTPQAPGDPNTTRAAAGAAPFQPLPGVPQPGTAYPPAHANPDAGLADTPPAEGGINHTVVSGDSLWGLARKYGTTIEAIQAANGMTNTTIRTGQSLIIPGR